MNFEEYIFGQNESEDIIVFEKMYSANYRIVYNYAAHFITDHSIRMDIVQDVYSYVWENRATLQIHKSFKSYLLTACHNTCINYINKRKVRQRHASHVLGQSYKHVDGYEAIFEQELRTKIEAT
ncbi:MAG: hypothetical protein JEZ14_04745 [Marinilabiliaceae bacterium]|nr:hypothetical protein [Marinilabiliaceae bacterium]